MEDIKKEYEDKFSGCYDEDTECVTIDNSTLWLWIESKIKDAKIAENEYWLGKFQSRYLVCAFEDRIKELKESE